MPRSWKIYTAKIEEHREPNIFAGPLGEGDEFVHYYRDREEGLGYFGVLTDDHTAWLPSNPTQEDIDASMAVGAEELAAKGLSIPEGGAPGPIT